MQPSLTLKNEEPLVAVFVVPPQVQLLDISGPAHVFYEAADYGASIDLKFVSVHKGVSEEISTSGLAFARLSEFEKITLGKRDLVFIPGLESALLNDTDFLTSIDPFLQWLREMHQKGARICSVCTGAFLLAEAGLLNGKQCTTHWKYLDVFSKRYPAADVVRNRLFVQADRLYSSAGVASGIDLALHLLEEQYGTQFAAAIAREVVVYLRRGEDDPQLSIFLQYRNHLEDRIHLVQDWLLQHLDKKINIDQLAEMTHTSTRNLTRLFKATTGITIGDFLNKLRVERAVQLIQTNEKIETVTRACGLKSPNQLRHLFKKHTGSVPSRYR